jgi:protein-tyrosine phosphatase
MGTPLHWADGPWPGRLTLAARPRGGDWLEDELAAWHRAGIDVVASMLTPEEERDLDLQQEGNLTRALGMDFVSLPIPDRETPPSEAAAIATIEELNRKLSKGKKIVIHCRQGVGRAGMIAACLLIANGIPVEQAIESLSAVRGIEIPETPEQGKWINHFAEIWRVPVVSFDRISLAS